VEVEEELGILQQMQIPDALVDLAVVEEELRMVILKELEGQGHLVDRQQTLNHIGKDILAVVQVHHMLPHIVVAAVAVPVALVPLVVLGHLWELVEQEFKLLLQDHLQLPE
tara:strand:- start:1247 stop:1579 length:333 start_codon:yes stop_codon:yes gene_type:complete